jgi:hypothetical protein
VIIGVLFGAAPEVLIDGIITHHQLAPSNEVHAHRNRQGCEHDVGPRREEPEL